MFLTTYALDKDGVLRHRHGNGTDGTPGNWHDASNPHPSTPYAHAVCHAFDPLSLWVKVNDDIDKRMKGQLMAEANYKHGQRLRNSR